MNLSLFRDRVKSYLYTDGQSLAATTTELDRIIAERLQDFSRRTLCLFDDRIVFTPVAGQASYPFTAPSATFVSGGVQVALCGIRHVFWDGSPLKNQDQVPGPTSLEEVIWDRGEYQNDADGIPGVWWTQPPGNLILHPAPDVETGSHTVSAWHVHPDITPGDDATVLSIPDLYLLDAAIWCAVGVWLPYAMGDSLKKCLMLQQTVERNMERYTNVNSRFHTSTPVRSGGDWGRFQI